MELEKEFEARVESDGLLGVSCSGSDTAWMRAVTPTLFLIRQTGEVVESVNTQTGTRPNDIFVTEDDEVLFTDPQNKCITRITKDREVRPWTKTGEFTPLSLYCTRDGFVIVSLLLETRSSESSVDDTNAKVVKFDSKGEPVLEIKNDINGKSLYKCPEYLSVNTNNASDLCVSDWGSKSVVVVNQSGEHRFTFEGPPKSSRRYPEFFPRDLVCDSEGRILIVDSGNECIHMLNSNGEFLSYLLTDDDGIEDPFTLSIDTTGRLWVGERHSKKVKIFKHSS
ncbi:hypothetical protein FSP39_013882 [Pinctada imbricata]|uniref:Uncharacterized protein n=1 Tax=Pinctada imbricata TaxID=66713 RepID=A0AA88Y7F8_PINIB|nr:hypothetical protein FSP39_013882 [Pinctada imbricata]